MRVSQAAALAALLVASTASTKPAVKTDPGIAQAIRLVRAELKDGPSARFEGVKALEKKGSYCGRVNAKNGYGGYTGFEVFYVHGSQVILLPSEASTLELCR